MKSLFLAGFCFLAGAVPILAGADDSPPAPGESIPIPPEQTQTWTPPPTKLAPVAVSAITELFNEGLADPRGCEYREIEIIETNQWTIKTHGWVLPETGTERYAIGWNGVVYAVKSIGQPMPLEKDIPDKDTSGGFRGLDSSWPENDNWSLSTQSVTPSKAALLLRLGRADLAEHIWQLGFVGNSELAKTDPYGLLANPWLATLYDRALSAHCLGNDTEALQTCRLLSLLEPICEASAAKRGIAKPANAKVYFKKLAQLPELAADQERRGQEQPYTPVLASGQPAEGPERIAGLIHDLELVSVQQWEIPGQTNTYTDPVVQALIKEGDPAVEPLLKCFEEDTRLTRTQYTEGMGFAGPLVHVYEPAYIALTVILDKPFSFAGSDGRIDSGYNASDPRDSDPRNLTLSDRKELGEKIRAYWEKNKSLSLPERWFSVLQDDKAGAEAWLGAVGKIVSSTRSTWVTFGLYGGGMGSGSQLEPNQPMKGEALRSKTNPSVSDLMIKRFEQLVQNEADHDFDLTSLSTLLLDLSYWDGKNHRDDLARLGKELDARFVRQSGHSSAEVNITLGERRLQLGDSSARQDYIRYLQSYDPRNWTGDGANRSGFFGIMWHYPDDPQMQELARKLFTGNYSPWVPLPNNLIPTPLIGLTAFREELRRGLTDKRPAGTIKVDRQSIWCVYGSAGASFSQSPGLAEGVPFSPKPGTTVSFRLCDRYANQLSAVQNFPECELYWPVEKRDEAVAACREFLQQYGNAYRASPEDSYDDAVGYRDAGATRFRLPQLDHPATEADVTAGRALFSLSGTTRVWKMPTVPFGPAWQAEEVMVDGHWNRYFGVFQDGKPTKVPAAEMEFPALPGKITNEIGGDMEGPSDRGDGDSPFMAMTHHPVPLGAPVPITVTVQNHNGLDQTVPAAVMIPAGATKTLPEGIGFSVTYSDKLPPLVQSFMGSPFDYGTFQTIPLNKEVVVSKGTTAGPVLGPMQSLDVLKIDLRDFFDLSRPGSYHVKALFHVPGQPASESNESDFLLEDTAHK